MDLSGRGDGFFVFQPNVCLEVVLVVKRFRYMGLVVHGPGEGTKRLINLSLGRIVLLRVQLLQN